MAKNLLFLKHGRVQPSACYKFISLETVLVSHASHINAYFATLGVLVFRLPRNIVIYCAHTVGPWFMIYADLNIGRFEHFLEISFVSPTICTALVYQERHLTSATGHVFMATPHLGIRCIRPLYSTFYILTVYYLY
jgi:hypothetical protein